jgi:hypothetical protein
MFRTLSSGVIRSHSGLSHYDAGFIAAGGAAGGEEQQQEEELMLTAQAPLTLVIDGCNSRLRRQLCLPQTEINVESVFVGLLLRNCHMPISNHGLVCLAVLVWVTFFEFVYLVSDSSDQQRTVVLQTILVMHLFSSPLGLPRTRNAHTCMPSHVLEQTNHRIPPQPSFTPSMSRKAPFVP